MKHSIFSLAICLVLYTCGNDQTKNPKLSNESNTSEELTLEGNWELVSYYNYRDNEVIDSFKTNEGFRQVKMYNDNKVMWSKLMPADSSEWFGYGSYTMSNDTLIEVLDYGSKVMNEVIAEKKQFVNKLILDKDKFIQIELDEDGNYLYSENYKRIKN